ncbi:hypothetical protein [Succinivibrio dextrinosolvens]|uniref:hypothetical protein n=1 Tax=Succinivibrio dextrinosolvens TaxID=83771 RepID=UPI00247A328A|nr:hypothetical protein [Succinivibrio dextrinosolvens]
MTNKKSKSIGLLFLGLSILCALLAGTVFFYKVDNELYNLSLSAPNSLPQKYVTLLKDKEKWKAIVDFAELYKQEIELNPNEVTEEIKKASTGIANSSVEAQEIRKTFAYWKTETYKAITQKTGEDAPQETITGLTSGTIDFFLGDYYTLYDSAKKYINKEEIDEFNTTLSAISVALGLSDMVTGGTTAATNKPAQYLLYVFRKGAVKMSMKFRSELMLQLKIIGKSPSKISRFQSLANIATKSPQMAIWLLSIPNTLEQGEKLWSLLSNCMSADEMKNVINQGTMMLTFYNNHELFNSINIEHNEILQKSDLLITEKSSNLSDKSVAEKIDENDHNKTGAKALFNKTIDYFGKKKEELLKKNNSAPISDVPQNNTADENKTETMQSKVLFEESAMINSLEEVISVLEIMDQQHRLSSHDLFFALCYGQPGMTALKQNRLSDFLVCRDDIVNNSFESKGKILLIQYRNIIISILCCISLLFLAFFITLTNKRITR